jgi:hypothetical protein
VLGCAIENADALASVALEAAIANHLLKPGK